MSEPWNTVKCSKCGKTFRCKGKIKGNCIGTKECICEDCGVKTDSNVGCIFSDKEKVDFT